MLLIQSRNDPYGTLAQIEAIEELARAPVEKYLFTECGHSPHVDRSEETLALIADFVNRNDPPMPE
jgi:pimeloyl-ACP methyl ester carboxylesterase